MAVYLIWQCGNTMEWEIFGISGISIFRLGVGNFWNFQFPRHCAQENAYIHVSVVDTYAFIYIHVDTRSRVCSWLFLEFWNFWTFWTFWKSVLGLSTTRKHLRPPRRGTVGISVKMPFEQVPTRPALKKFEIFWIFRVFIFFKIQWNLWSWTPW